jgi:hypothetical protein
MREQSSVSIRRVVALVLLCGGLALIPAGAQAADPSKVGLGTDTLMIGILYEEEAGTYQQEGEVVGGQLLARLTFHLPAAPTTAQPGPVVVLWQLRIDVADGMYGDIVERLVGPPVVEAVLPDCDATGACDLQIEVGGSVTPALEAVDLDWVSDSGAGLYVAVTLVRTYADGSLLQAVRPRLASGGGGGTLAQPMTITGGLTLSALIRLDTAEAHHAEISTEEFGIGGPAYDWGAAVTEALGEPSSPAPSQSPVAKTGTEGRPNVVLAVEFVAVILVSMVLLVVTMYKRGGVAAIKRQGGTLIALTLILTIIATAIYVVAETHRGLLISLVPFVASASALIAGIRARTLSARDLPRRSSLVIGMWLVAGAFGLVALASAAMLLYSASKL